MNTPEWARDPEILFDQPTPEDTTPLIAQGISHYTTAVRHLVEYHTGDPDMYLTPHQTYRLAQASQASQVAAEELEALQDDNTKRAARRRSELETIVAEGVAARAALVEANLPLAAWMARASMNILTAKDREDKRYIGTFSDITKLRSRYASPEDRIQVANLGLLEAAKKFKPQLDAKGKPVSFTTYATWSIQNELHRYIRSEEPNGARLPIDVANDMAKSRKAPEKFAQDRLASLQEWAEQRTFDPLEELTSNRYPHEEREDDADVVAMLPVESVLHDDNFHVSPEEGATQAHLEERLYEAMDTLADRESGVIALRFGITDGEPRSLDEIGKVYGVTRERIRQIESKTMSKLRHPSRSERLKDWFEAGTSGEEIYRGRQPSPQTGDFAGMLGTVAVPQSKMPAPVQPPEQSADIPKDSWQVDPSEEWDTPVRRFQIETDTAYDRAGRIFTDIMMDADYEHFARTQPTAGVETFYPGSLVTEINENCGMYLRAHHIERFWNNNISKLTDRLMESAGDDFSYDRLSLFFSQLLAERMTDNDKVELVIPDNLNGKLHMFASNLTVGELDITGDLGDFAAYHIGGIASVTVHGNVGDYAGAEMENQATLQVTGDAGKELAYGATDGVIVVKGFVDSLALRPRFAGEVTVGSAKKISLAAPKDAITVLRR